MTGAFGVVLQSVYHDPQTNDEMEVAVKGLKGNIMQTRACTYWYCRVTCI